MQMKYYKESIYNQKTVGKNKELLISNALYNTYVKVAANKKEEVLNILDKSTEIVRDQWSDIHKKLYKLGFIVEANKNEIALADYYCNDIVYSNDMLHLTIIPTDACNFRCRYCYQDSPKHYIEKEIVEKIKKFLNKNIRKYRGVFISWYGGEPLLAKEIVLDIMKYTKQICSKYGIPLYGQMTTNGYELNSELFNELLDNHLMSYMITIDGSKETHNDQRPHVTNSDSYQRILGNLKEIRDKVKRSNFRIGVRINITPKIKANLKDYIELIGKEFGGDSRFGMIWEWVKDWGGDRICDNLELLIDSYDKTDYEKFLDYITENGIQMDRGQAKTRLGGEMCIASRRHGFLINYNGKVYKCAMALFDPELEDVNCIGEIDNEGNLDVDEYKNSIWVGQGKLPEKCKECKSYPECMGLLCPLALKIREVFECPEILKKEQDYISRNLDYLGRFQEL